MTRSVLARSGLLLVLVLASTSLAPEGACAQVVAEGDASAYAQPASTVPAATGAYLQPAYAPAVRSPIDEAVIAWDVGDRPLAVRLAREARREAPDDALVRLVSTGLSIDLDPHVVLTLGEAERAAALAELDAIGAQRDTGHILGIVSGGVGAVALLVVGYLPTVIEPSCSIGCETSDRIRFGGGVVGIAALIVGGVAVGFQVDAGGRTSRWGESLRGGGTMTLGPGSLRLTF
jgi:hypothetical protein